MPSEVKKLLGDNSNFVNSEKDASLILKTWELATPAAKKLLAENLVKNPTMTAQQIIDTLHGNTVGLFAVDKTGAAVNAAAVTVSKLQGKTVDLNANAKPAGDTLTTFLTTPASKTIDLIINKTNNAQGTPYHPGGLAMVNDQKGPTYKELISLPNGTSFIPQGRDVTLPLPKGTSILKASETAKLIPKYANGTGAIPANSKIFSRMRSVQSQLVVNAKASSESSQLQLIVEMLKVISNSGSNNDVVNAMKLLANRPVEAYFDRKKVTAEISKQQALNQSIENIINGRI